jgi:hypothetical protein
VIYPASPENGALYALFTTDKPREEGGQRSGIIGRSFLSLAASDACSDRHMFHLLAK